jgi:hypothetical protein
LESTYYFPWRGDFIHESFVGFQSPLHPGGPANKEIHGKKGRESVANLSGFVMLVPKSKEKKMKKR